MSSNAAPQPNHGRRADSVSRKKVNWLWGNRVPEGMLTLIAGRPGQGKSLLMVLLAAELNKQSDVIFSNREDPIAQVVRPRLEAAGAKLNRVHFFEHTTLPDDLELLEAFVREVKAKAIILDPIAAHLTPSMYNDQDVRKALTPVSKMLERTGCSMIAASHTVKYVGPKAHPLTAIGGSGGGLVGAARALYLFGIDPADKDQRALVPVKFNLGPMPKAMTFELDEIEFLDEKDRLETVAGRLIVVSDNENIAPLSVLSHDGGSQTGGKTAEKREAAAEWLTNYLSLGKRPVNDIREDAIQVGVSWATIRRAANDIEVEINRVGFGKGSQSFWALPDGHPGLLIDLDEEAEVDAE